ncbi:RHS repeat-associated core domain-containing protein [Pseudomonas sp. BW13M1]|uniref:RHS repeat-associated core domain-containing protein n=2 Tax=Pseudomonas peradeniyensis TaxID=2745488 RepID=A0A923GDP2_9PSED|nr:RHS repeat-associated core domain-containing protein [Pseudomonas peradeniyensis]MBV4507534.1 RHS repeat-associated core domain-containing protein [Pseudomonas peradeniyensis]
MARSRCGFRSHAYTAFGYSQHQPTDNDGFQGQRVELSTGHYLLGNGYRAYNPALMRFNSPDSYSPFDRGGINCYCFALNSPTNFSDPSGHATQYMYRLQSILAADFRIVSGLTSFISANAGMQTHIAYNGHGGPGFVQGMISPDSNDTYIWSSEISKVVRPEHKALGLKGIAAFCYSADMPTEPGQTSIAHAFANELDQPTIGFFGEVFYNPTNEGATDLKSQPAHEYGIIMNQVGYSLNFQPASFLPDNYLSERLQSKKSGLFLPLIYAIRKSTND